MKAHCLAAIAALSVSATAFAGGDGEALFRQNNCGSCHAAANKSVGPALADIAAKYRGDRSAPARLEAKVRSGGGGSFGAMPMPPTPRTVGDGDIRTMVAWILAQK